MSKVKARLIVNAAMASPLPLSLVLLNLILNNEITAVIKANKDNGSKSRGGDGMMQVIRARESATTEI